MNDTDIWASIQVDTAGSPVVSLAGCICSLGSVHHRRDTGRTREHLCWSAAAADAAPATWQWRLSLLLLLLLLLLRLLLLRRLLLRWRRWGRRRWLLRRWRRRWQRHATSVPCSAAGAGAVRPPSVRRPSATKGAATWPIRRPAIVGAGTPVGLCGARDRCSLTCRCAAPPADRPGPPAGAIAASRLYTAADRNGMHRAAQVTQPPGLSLPPRPSPGPWLPLLPPASGSRRPTEPS